MRGGLALTFAVAALAVLPAAAPAATPARLQVLSNRADLVSDGQALVAVTLPKGAKWSKAKVLLGRGSVKRAFVKRGARRFEGVVPGLKIGANTLAVRLPKNRG